ncbi:MAG: hypothetical protein IT336_12655 [Thermomicrobiales bacterium]|nr:hypothetical protein [Thermomicrobiales bacterium]
MKPAGMGSVDRFEGAYGNSYVTGHLHRQRERQERAIAAAERRRVLREAGIAPGGIDAGRVRARLGRVMTGIGYRLQGVNPRVMRPAGEMR